MRQKFEENLIKVLDFIGKYGFIFVGITFIVSYFFFIPSLSGMERNSMRAFLTVAAGFSPMFVLAFVVIINLTVSLPLQVGREFNKRLLESD